MTQRNRVLCFKDDYAHSDNGLKDPIVVRSELSDEDNRARVAAECPWAAVVQKENWGFSAYEDPDDARRALARLEKMGLVARTKSASIDMLKRFRINRRQP